MNEWKQKCVYIHTFCLDGAWGDLIPRGGGVLSLEKGTDCRPTAAELWLLRVNIAKKEGRSSHYECA